ncbi:Putative effector of murein hydrolase LrgA, UPF0299 family [Salinihabitans flavidus]|uniref:Putative effector of murein hydrolase LrgA, UPF0299 family n=1 Tax=Salinihabitans flavidus TaxID=569882 RepID=A0A1H8SJT4_9RHOB|nr:CidA/LrgA family protein [Salinihabitans flavidus]SEO78825.1 Putative effector of murein hydrolase LrgA, UPF0299 family [Salinihabitans flavidus]
MIVHIAVILMFQLLGETLARGLDLPVPGPVLGMAGLLALFLVVPGAAKAITPTAQGILAHLSLLFVPAGVGVTAHLGLLSQAGPALVLALLISTVLALAVGALAFVALARLTGVEEDAQ